ncbi:unnamed protein product [Closterium sp. NIES-54]
MYALSVSAEGDCYLCVPPDPGIEAAALGASESTPPGNAPAEALHTFTLDSSASRCFFRDSTTLTPLPAPVPVRMADPSGCPVLTRSSTVLPCPAVPSGSMSGLHLPSFSTNLVSTAALQDAMVTTTTPGGQRLSICMCTRTGRHLATFTRRPGSILYTLTTEPPQVAASTSASGQLSAPCSCRRLSHQTLLWHHRLGHPSLPRLCGMHSRLLVSGLPRSLPPLPPSPAPPCLPCGKGRQCTAPHSSSFPPTTAPLQTLHLDVWGPARVRGQGHERYFLLVVDDYSHYTTVFPLRNKGEVLDVLIPWIHAVHLQLRERFDTDLPVLGLHSDKGGEFASDLLRDFCHGEGITQSFSLPASLQQNGVAERSIGLVMEVARTSMIHAAAPQFLWSFAVRYAAHQLNLWPCVSLSETSPTLRWTGEVGDASVFRLWGSHAFVHDTSADKLSARAIHCIFLGFPLDAHGWRLPPHLAPCPALSGSHGPAPSGVSQVDPVEPVEVVVDSGTARGGATRGAVSGGAEPAGGGLGLGGAEPERAEPGGAKLGGAKPERPEPGGTELERAEPGGAELGGAEPERTEPGGTLSTRGPPGALSRREPLSPPQLREWFARRWSLRSGNARAKGPAAGGPGAGGTGAAGVGAAGGTGAASPGCACTGGNGVAGAGGAADIGAGDPGAGDTGAGGAGAVGTGARGTVRPRPYFFPLLQQVLRVPSSTGLTPPLLCPPPNKSQPPLQPASPLPAPSPYTEQTRGLTERREPRQRPPPVSGTHNMALRPSSVPQRVPLPSPPVSSLADGPDLESDLVHAASPTVPHLRATVVTDTSFESAIVSALVAELVDFAAACRLDSAASLVAESESDCPPSVGGECALGTDVLEDRQEDFECFAAAVPHLVSMLIAPEGDPDALDILTPRSYVEAITVPPPGANIVDGMWIFKVKRPPCSPPAFKVRYVARGFMEHPAATLRSAAREWHDILRTTLAALGFSPSIADPSLFLRTDNPLPPFYIPVYFDDLVFATADSEALALVKSELQKRHTCTDMGELRSYLGLRITQDRARCTITQTQSHMVHKVLQRFGFRYSSPQSTPLLFLTVHSFSAPPLDESVEPSGPYPELVGYLMYLMTCTRPDLAYPLSILARYVAPGRHRPDHWEAAKRVLCYLCSTSGMGLVVGVQGPVVLTRHADASWIYAWAMAAQELRWVTYLLTDLGERPRSPPVLYVDNKAMIALCQEHRLEHRTKHIALHYFLARELQQRGQLHLAYVATRANTADMFTKALQPGLVLVPILLLIHPFLLTLSDILNTLRILRIHRHVLWTDQRPCNLSNDHERSLPPALDKCIIMYLGDILIYNPDIAQHLQDIEAVFKILNENRLLTKASKCEFLQDRLEFLGHIISAEGVEIDPKKIATIQAWHAQTNLTVLQSFLGFVNYVRRFVLDMAKLSAPLTDLLRKGVEYTWGEKEQAAFSALKQILCSPPVLHIADPHCPFELVTDASDIAVGAVLLQAFGNGLQPIAYESRKMHPPERNYPIHDCEMLAIAHAFKVWRCYLTGADVTVRTDHRSL